MRCAALRLRLQSAADMYAHPMPIPQAYLPCTRPINTPHQHDPHAPATNLALSCNTSHFICHHEVPSPRTPCLVCPRSTLARQAWARARPCVHLRVPDAEGNAHAHSQACPTRQSGWETIHMPFWNLPCSAPICPPRVASPSYRPPRNE